MSQENDPKRQPSRKLGRGLESLLKVPVEIVIPPSTKGGSGESDLSGPGWAGLPGTSHANSPSEGRDSRSKAPGSSKGPDHESGAPPVPRGTPPSDVSSLIPEDATHQGLVLLALDQLRPNPRQPRQDFEPAAIASLAESIRTAGLMQPIVVRAGGDGAFEIIAGERRWRAARQLGLLTIPAIVRDVDDQTAAEWALIENIQRADLNPIERSAGLRRLIDDFGLTHQELGERVGLDRATVSNLLRLADLDPFSRDAVRTGKLTQGHAKALLAISRLDLRQTLAAASISGEWSVRELERRVRQTVEPVPERASYAEGAPLRSSAHLEDLERRLSEHLGSRVNIQLGRKRGSGRILIDFYSLDQFDGILAKLGFSEAQ